MVSLRRLAEMIGARPPARSGQAWDARPPGRVERALSLLWLGETDWESSARAARSAFSRWDQRLPGDGDPPSPPEADPPGEGRDGDPRP